MSMLEFPSPLVAVDVDDTVADLLGEWLRRYNEASGDTLLPEDIDRWHLPDLLKDDWKANPARFYGLLADADVYRHVLPIMGARKAVRRFKDAGCRVVFVSHCSSGSEVHKLAWLRRYGFVDNEKDFVSARDKSLIAADYLIDDGPHNVASFKGQAFLVNQPHNSGSDNIPGVLRVRDVMQAADIILSRSSVTQLGRAVV